TILDSVDVLSKSIVVDAENNFEPSKRAIAGPNRAINTYILALGSSKYHLPVEAYANSVYNKYDSLRFEKLEELDIDVFAELMSSDSIVQSKIHVLRQIDTLMQVSIVDSMLLYGEPLLLGDIKGSLMDLYRP